MLERTLRVFICATGKPNQSNIDVAGPWWGMQLPGVGGSAVPAAGGEAPGVVRELLACGGRGGWRAGGGGRRDARP